MIVRDMKLNPTISSSFPSSILSYSNQSIEDCITDQNTTIVAIDVIKTEIQKQATNKNGTEYKDIIPYSHQCIRQYAPLRKV